MTSWRTTSFDALAARVMSVVLVLGVGFQSVVTLLTNDTLKTPPGHRYAATGVVVVCCILALALQRSTFKANPPSQRHRLAYLLAVLCLYPVACGAWSLMTLGYFSGLLLGPQWQAAAFGLALAAAAFASGNTMGDHPLIISFVIGSSLVFGAILYTFTRLMIVIDELARTREHVARMRVDEERSRITRQLHDILGRSLVATSLRLQTAVRLLPTDPAAAERQLGEAWQTVTSSQAQLRTLTRGETFIGLPTELDSAARLFDLLRVGYTFDEVPELEEASEEQLARVLRECVTNILKHARPRHVDVGLRTDSTSVVLSVVNDGMVPSSLDEGTGLRHLADRLAELGGTLEAGPVGTRRFRVIARLPRTSGPQEAV